MSANFQELLLQRLATILEPIATAIENDLIVWLVRQETGWDLTALDGTSTGRPAPNFAEFVSAYKSLDALLANPPQTLAQFLQALEMLDQLFETVRHVFTSGQPPTAGGPAGLGRLGQDLVEARILGYIETFHPLLSDLLVLLTIVQPLEKIAPGELVLDQSGKVLRLPVRRAYLRLAHIQNLLSDPVHVLKSEYLGAGSIETRDQAQAVTDKLFPRLAQVLLDLGARAVYGLNPTFGLDFGATGNELGAGMLTVFFDSDVDGSSFGVTLALSSAAQGDLGLVVTPFGDLEYEQVLGDWGIALKMAAGVQAFALGPQGFTLLAEPSTTAVRSQLSLTKLAKGEDPVFLVGSTTGTRLEIGQLRISGDASLSNSDRDFGLTLEFGSAALVIAPDDGDSFLSELLPSEGVHANFDLALGWSNRLGFYFRGSAGLEAQLAIQKSIAGFLSVDQIYLAIRTQFSDFHTIVAASASVRLGPVTVVVEQIGLQTTFTFPESGGNLGVLNLSLDFKPPTGMGIVVDTGPITGGGFLGYDDAAGRYTGALELEIYNIAVKAIGILDTRLPGGRPAYSFLILISSEFTPIPLGLGFMLEGVGGLAGIHRSVNVELLRSRLGDKRLNHILFPEDPVRDVVQIVSDLQEVFPPTADRYVFGPMARISWGTAGLLTGELGILLELPEPVRLVLLGQFRAALPRPDNAIAELNLDVLGVLDLEHQLLALDGRLRDSRVASFTIEGAFALRLVGGDSPNFALAIGGFHPDYKPPTGFPELKRITIPIGLDDDVRITLTGYLALTSNTLQVGAAAEVYAEAGGFNILGKVSFDTLFTFSPFAFITDFSGKVTLRMDQTELATISLEATLSGPAPWHAWGEACLEIRWWPDICVPFDVTFGREQRVELPVEDPWLLLRESIENPDNWSGGRPNGAYRGATLASVPGTSNLLDPIGEVTFRQSVVPLNRQINRFGQTRPPGGADRFTIGKVTASKKRVDWSQAEDFFAPAQFEELSDAEKLSRPSFERMEAGFTLARAAVDHGEPVGTRVEYETIILDSAFTSRHDKLYLPDLEVQLGALERVAAQSPLQNSGRRKFTPPAVQPLVTLTGERFVVASRADLSQRADIAQPTGKGAAFQALASYLASHPGEVGQFEVISLDELSA